MINNTGPKIEPCGTPERITSSEELCCIFVKLNNHNSSELVIRSGVPQGSILGPVLLIIFMNDISLCQVSDPLLSWYIYADDTTKISTAKTIDNLRQTMVKDSKPLERWVDSNGMVINMPKTKCVVAGTRARLES